MSRRFINKVAFVTGAASGIGRATSVAFATEGARVAILDRTEDALQETADTIRSAGGEVVIVACDVSKPEEVEAAVARIVGSFGRLDVAFNNAGVENKGKRGRVSTLFLDGAISTDVRQPTGNTRQASLECQGLP